jgi:hypothetical protein
MFLILASRYDRAAQTLRQHWSDRAVGLLTSADLSVSGWQYHPTNLSASTAVVEGKVIPMSEISGVMSRLSAVLPHEINHIVEGDRPYVAAEMTAFLSAWLKALPCTVFNRPAATYLLGPTWRASQWMQAAARLGIPVPTVATDQTIRLETPTQKSADLSGVAVTIVGDRVLGEVASSLIQQAQQLATAAGVNLATFYFSGAMTGATFLGAELWIDLSASPIIEALWDVTTQHKQQEYSQW